MKEEICKILKLNPAVGLGGLVSESNIVRDSGNPNRINIQATNNIITPYALARALTDRASYIIPTMNLVFSPGRAVAC